MCLLVVPSILGKGSLSLGQKGAFWYIIFYKGIIFEHKVSVSVLNLVLASAFMILPLTHLGAKNIVFGTIFALPAFQRVFGVRHSHFNIV